MPVALVYVRKSVVRANKPTLSPQRQQESCVAFCEEKGWANEIFADAEGHRSGRSEKGRPEWMKLKARLQASSPGDVAAVVVYSLDRSSRSTRDFLNFLHLLQEKKADFVSVTQPYLDTTSAVGRAFMSMISIWSELEANMDSERVVADIAFRQESGLFFGNCPVGYSRQMVNGERIPMPDANAPKVVRIWEEYANGRHSFRSLTQWINDVLQLPTQRGGPWTRKHVQIMFEDWEFYCGWVTRHRKRGGQQRFRGKHPAIISEELAEAVRTVRLQRQDSRFSNRIEPRFEYLLTPMLYCQCGAHMRGKMSHNLPHYQHWTDSCSYSIVDAEPLERMVIEHFEGLDLPPDVEYLIEKEIKAEAASAAISDDDRKKIEKLQARKERAKRSFELGLRDEAWLLNELTDLDEGIRKLRPPVAPPYNARDIADAWRALGALINDPATPRPLLKSMLYQIIERIETNGETITKLQPRRWFLQFLKDCSRDFGDFRYPQGNTMVQDGAFRAKVLRFLAIA